jgi:isoleucyl-tRNA synthetase
MAPMTPFISEEMFKNLTGKASVHLVKYPEANKEYINQEIIRQMNLAKKIVEAGLAKRSDANIKVRQPLALLQYGGKKLDSDIENIIADEINVKKVVCIEERSEDWLMLDTNITSELMQEGLAREIIRSIQSLRKDSGFQVTDRIVVHYQTGAKELSEVMENASLLIKKEVLAEQIINRKENFEGEAEFSLSGSKIWFGLARLKNAQET